uniref:Obg-like ATPase 1 n=1 Tax=Ciona savignyi TaxID=51511 RepID=H2Z0M5_CIOSA
KKKEIETPPLILGRLGTSLKIGIVGLPNVGKSTFFNVLTKSQAAAENFPFCTIDPNESRVPVPDERWEFLVNFHKPASKVPAFLSVVDIAGLVKGASEGQGLNAFLSHISGCDAIFHMTRAFDDAEFETLTKIKMLLVDEKRPVRDGEWGSKEIDVLNDHLFLTSKPQIYLVNLSEKDYVRKKNKWLMKIKTWVQEHDSSAILIPFSGAFELKLSELGEDGERESYLKEEYKDAVSSALNKIIVTGFKALGLEYFFTAGVDEVKAWTIKKGTLAPQAAGRIHSDFEKGFIMAEVQKFADFKELGSETAVKAAGKYRQQGRNYIVEDGDIIFFKFNTPSQPKKK